MNFVYGGFADAEFFSECLLLLACSNALADISNAVLRKFRHVVFLSSLVKKLRCSAAAAFSNFIGYVVGICSNPKMVWIDAPRVITGMANMRSVRDGADEMLVGKTMRADELPIDTKSPVPLLISAGDPLPATVITINNFLHKSLKMKRIHTPFLSVHAGYNYTGEI